LRSRRALLRLGARRIGLPVALGETRTLAALAVAGPVLVAAEWPVGPLVLAVVVLPLVLPFWAPVMLAAALRARLRLMTRRHERLLEPVLATLAFVAEIVEALGRLGRPAHAVAAAVGSIARLIELVAIGHDDTAVVLGVLQVVLRQHRISRGLGIAREGDVLLGDMRRRTADLHVRAVRLEAARQRVVVVTALTIVVAATSAAILLSLPH
jgi:hypothetical protein